MNYELALKLKNAGFPQILGRDFIFPDSHIERDMLKSKPDMACRPTLGELIEAYTVLLLPFEGKVLVLETYTGATRNFDISYVAYCRPYNDNNFASNMMDYESPEEAVAQLYLELNKK